MSSPHGQQRPCQKNGGFRPNLPERGEARTRGFRALGSYPLIGGLTLVLLVLAGACTSVPRTFHPEPALPPSTFTHAAWDRALRAHVVNGQVDYPAMAKDKSFAGYLAALDHVDPQAFPSREERLAFWINAYNALAVKSIIDGYSPESLWGKYRFFIAHDHAVGGTELNLYDLEHEILIPLFNEPRIHFAIVCASRSCPKLQPWAYDPDKLDGQLDQAARMFINDPSRNRFDREKRVARLSMIFNWFVQDFIAEAGSLIYYVKQFLEDQELVTDLELRPYRIEYLEYDWSLNGIPLQDD